MRGTATLLLLACVLVAGPVLAHGEKDRVMGTITSVRASHLEIEASDGHVVSVELDGNTSYFQGKARATFADVKVGSRVVVHLTKHGTHQVAREVRLPTEPKTKRQAREQIPHPAHGHAAVEREGTRISTDVHDHGKMQDEVGGASLEPHQRMASGTAWQPEDAPMHAFHNELGGWSVTTHGVVYLMYDRQSGPRGATRGAAPNWVMGLAQRPVGRGDLGLRAMLSLDNATVRPRGYPLLFQTGETFEGRPLVDAQHPHDLFMELSASYTFRLAERTGLQLYAAPVGEPALGPVAFPHRVSALDLPVAVLGHHQQDSTHISFGVLTGALIHRNWKVEGSWFNGHEPDGHRWGFDPIRLNSYSGRVSYSTGPHWVFQVSSGRLDSPEELVPGEDLTRTTASVLFASSSADRSLAAALIWGRNDEPDGVEDSITLEGTLTFREKNRVFGRVERVEGRTGLIDVSDPESGPSATVNAFSLGLGRDIFEIRSMPVSVSVLATVYEKDEVLDPVYGENPTSFYVFFRLIPPKMHGTEHH